MVSFSVAINVVYLCINSCALLSVMLCLQTNKFCVFQIIYTYLENQQKGCFGRRCWCCCCRRFCWFFKEMRRVGLWSLKIWIHHIVCARQIRSTLCAKYLHTNDTRPSSTSARFFSLSDVVHSFFFFFNFVDFNVFYWWAKKILILLYDLMDWTGARVHIHKTQNIHIGGAEWAIILVKYESKCTCTITPEHSYAQNGEMANEQIDRALSGRSSSWEMIKLCNNNISDDAKPCVSGRDESCS